MKCNGTVIFKGIEKREGGVFKNDKGQEINYEASYLIKFDDITDGKINERKLKFSTKNLTLFEKLKTIEPYTKIELYCDVVISNNACKLVPLDISAPADTNDKK